MSKDQPFIGVDLGGTNIQVGIVDSGHKVLARAKKKTKAAKGEDEVIDRIADVVKNALKEGGLSAKNVGGLGIGAPGAIEEGTGVVLNAPNLRWTDFPLAEELRKRLDVPVTVDNDVNVGTWGEHVAGAARKHNDLLGVFVGTGIGAGLVLNGELFHGFHHTAGEIGHLTIHADAPRGRRTLENVASRTAMADHLRRLIEANHESEISEITDGDLSAIRSKVLAKAIAADDGLTIEVVHRAAMDVGIAVANVVTLLSLPCVVIGGGLTDALDERWMRWVRETFDKYVFPAKLRECELLASKLGDDAGVIGAADLGRRRLG